MPDKIQRVPRGLLELLSLQGGRTPELLADQVAGTIELSQYYANLTPAVFVDQNAALASGGSITRGIPTAPPQWWLLLGVCAQVTKTATMTRCRISTFARSMGLAVEEMSFITATTGLCTMATWVAPYPMLMQPGDSVTLSLDLLAGDATADVRLRLRTGILG